MEWLEQILGEQTFANLSYLSSQIEVRLVGSIVVVVVLWLIRLIIQQIIGIWVKGPRARYNWRKFSTYIIVAIGVVILGGLWLRNFTSLVTFLGLLSAGLAIALQGPLTDLAGWLYAIWRRPFEVGDRIQIGDDAGDVVDLRIFKFTLLEIGNWVHADQSTGRLLHIPNRRIFGDVIANYNKGIEYIWHEIEVHITFESNWEKARVILNEIANRDTAHLSQDAADRVREAARRYYIFYHHLTPIVYLRVETSGVLLTLRYLCDPRRRRSTEQAIWEDILRAFSEHRDIEFAYPTQRFYQRHAEDNVTRPGVAISEAGGLKP